MNSDVLSTWLNDFGRAWILRDSMQASALFTDEAIYQEGPFSDPLRGRPAIRTYWDQTTADQSDIDFGFEIFSMNPNLGIAHWWASYTSMTTNEFVKLDGIAVISLNAQNLCISFHEWSNRLAVPAE
jgi:hypothetical protein